MVKADWKRWDFRWRLEVDRVSIERMCAGKRVPSRRCRHRKRPRGKVASNIGWSGKVICIGRTQGSGRKIVRNEFRQVETLRCMKDTIRYDTIRDAILTCAQKPTRV